MREFREHVGAELPAARTVALCFDKIDAERGMDGMRGPDGETRTLRHPWSLLAFQIAGADGLQAVVAVFLHSQPIGRKAYTPELVRMAGSAAPDAIEIEKGLRRWRGISWFLDDEDAGGDEPDAGLPKSWRLGNRPNLRQMHDEACRQRVSREEVEARLEETIRAAKSLTDGARAAGATVHLLPSSPRDVGDDGSFRYVVLGASAASGSGKPSPEAVRILDQTTGPDRPRVHRNAVVPAVPSRDGLEAARAAVRALLGWEGVQRRLDPHAVDPIRAERLRRKLRDARALVPDVVRQAYGVVVTAGRDNAAHAFKLPAAGGPLFPAIKNDERARIKETAVDAEALLPDGPTTCGATTRTPGAWPTSPARSPVRRACRNCCARRSSSTRCFRGWSAGCWWRGWPVRAAASARGGARR